MGEITIKTCKKCGLECRDSSDIRKNFYPIGNGRYFSSLCKECISKENKKKRADDEWLQNRKEYQAKWREENKDTQKIKAKIKREENKEQISNYFKSWYEKNKTKFNENRKDKRNIDGKSYPLIQRSFQIPEGTLKLLQVLARKLDKNSSVIVRESLDKLLAENAV